MSETESALRCKVIVIRRGAVIRFGVAGMPPEGAFPWMPFPDLLAIDKALTAWAREALGLEPIRIHERFVERPRPAGPIYYLIEWSGGEREPAMTLLWLEAAAALRRLPAPDRAALARAMRYLAGSAGGRL